MMGPFRYLSSMIGIPLTDRRPCSRLDPKWLPAAEHAQSPVRIADGYGEAKR
jgi:hypothetical protein